MKKLLLTFVLLVGIVFGLFAQKLTYQAVIRDNNQQLVTNTAVKATAIITFSTGNPYSEVVNGSTNVHGLLSFEFGDETLAGRDWTGATIAVKVVNAATPSTVYVNDEARPVSAVPYALNVNGQSIQNYLNEHHYVDLDKLNDTLSAYSTTAVMDGRHYLTSDSAVITTMQSDISRNAAAIGNLTLHTAKAAIRDSVAGQIHDSIADIAAKSHTHGNKDLLDTYNQTNADLADAVAKKHVHDNASVLAATTAPYTDADSIKLKGIAEGAEVNVQADWNQSTTTADDYIKNKPTIPTVPTNVSAFNNDAGYITSTDVPAQVNADWNATSGTAQILNKPELFSGNYNDLSNKPTIPAAANNATLTIQKNGTSVGTFTADASSDKSINITVPTTTSELTNNSGFITTANVPTNVSQLNNDAGYLTNADLTTLLSAINGKIDSLAHLVDSLSNLPHGGGGTPTVADGQPCPGTATVSDVDGNTYNTVKIGNQCWMKENLRTTTKRNNVGNVYTENTTAGYNAETYGYYYDWEAVMQNESGDKVQGICPTGWHVPTWAEYLQLTDYVNSQPIFCCYGESGKISKALASSEGWASVDRPDSECCIGNAPARNNWTRFSLMPAGYYLSGYRESGMEATIWSATDLGSMVHVLRLFYASDEIGETLCLREMGCSVRCLRDASIGGGDNPSEPATMSCEQVMQCMGDTLGRLNAKIEAQGNTIDTLAHLVDSLSNLTPGGEPTATFICGTSTVTDHEGNVYNTVQVGDQCWTKENMRCTTSPSTGTSILEYPASSYSYTGKKAYYPNDNASNVATYGLLYNWNAAVDTFNTAYGETSTNTSLSNAPSVTFGGNRRGICPVGWHVPSDAEWDTLTSYVGGQTDYQCGGDSYNSAKALASTTGWNTSSAPCTVGYTPADNNATGFSAVPAGYYYSNGCYDFGYNAYFWSATQSNRSLAYNRYLYYSNANVSSYGDLKDFGYSVRCLRDGGVGGAPATNESGSAGNAGGSSDSGCCTELGARMDSLQNVIANLQNTVSSQDSVINALNNELHPSFDCGRSTVKDHEGNVYNTVQIGDQCWTRENMRCTTSPSTGTSILEYPASSYSYTGKKAYYPNGNSSNVATYGLLYNWNAAVDTFNTAYGETSTNTSLSNAVSVTFSGNRRGICPVGWHVPSDAEWTALTTYVGGQTDYQCDGDSLNNAKALASTTGWITSSAPCTVGCTPADNNATGFSAVPAGYYYSNGCYDFGYYAGFWSATQYDSYYAYYRYLYYFNAIVNSYGGLKDFGYSVRCLRDESGASATLPTVTTTSVANITQNSAASGGNVTADGGATVAARGVCWSTSQNPTTADSHTTDGSGTGNFTSSITGLSANTTYYVRAYATNSEGTAYGEQKSFTTAIPFTCDTSTVTDYDGNTYNTVQIGQQCWMKQNLKTTHYSDGTSISLGSITSPASTTTAYRYNPNDNSSNVATYGYLYNWKAVMRNTSSSSSNPSGVQGICPTGWHVPSDAEWMQLTNYVGSQSQYLCGSIINSTRIAKALASTTGWDSSTKTCAVGIDPSYNNATGFSAVPAGYYLGPFTNFGEGAYFWSATQYSSNSACSRGLYYDDADVDSDYDNKNYGYSVRCLRD